MELLSSNIKKKFRKWKPQEKFPVFQKTKGLKKLLICQEMKLFSPPRENLLYFRKQNPRKKFLYIFSKENFSYFPETETPKRKLSKASYISGELARLKKQTKKSSLKKFLICYNVFAIFTSVEHMEIPCETKNITQI